MPDDIFTSVEPAWVGQIPADSGPGSVILLSSVRIRRNIDGFPFPSKCGKSQLYDVAALALGSLGRSPVWDDCDFRPIDSLDDASRHLLLEMNMITPKFMRGGAGRFLLRDSSGMITCMINEEDHISISSTYPGLGLDEALKRAAGMERSLDIKLVRDAALGYLTSNPAYAGTGTTVTVILHLPALDVTDAAATAAGSLKRDWNGLELGKLLPFGNESCGSFYALSNRITLSVTPEETARNAAQAAQALASKEMYARRGLRVSGAAESGGGDMNDRFWRAWGLLRHAKKLTFAEAVDAFSFVKLGSDVGILPRIGDREWRRMIIGCQRYHMSRGSGVIIEQPEEQFARAAMFRQFIDGLSAGAGS